MSTSNIFAGSAPGCHGYGASRVILGQSVLLVAPRLIHKRQAPLTHSHSSWHFSVPTHHVAPLLCSNRETNLKCRQCLIETAEMGQDDARIGAFNGEISCETPNNLLNKYDGVLHWQGKSWVPQPSSLILPLVITPTQNSPKSYFEFLRLKYRAFSDNFVSLLRKMTDNHLLNTALFIHFKWCWDQQIKEKKLHKNIYILQYSQRYVFCMPKFIKPSIDQENGWNFLYEQQYLVWTLEKILLMV